MARTIAEIQKSITDAKSAEPDLASLTSSSNVAIWRLWTYVIAVCIWTLENLFDFHKKEVADIIAAEKAHTLQWYVMKAKQFQYGVALPDDSDTYPVISDDPPIAIIKYAAAVELTNLVRIKVAKLVSGSLEGLIPAEQLAFSAYMNRIKDAGVRLQLTSGDADNLRLKLKVHYDPLILTNNGARVDGDSGAPVKDAVKVFLSNLPFNGLFVLNNLITALQAIEGVRIGEVLTAEANYASTAFVSASPEYSPDAGYMKLDETFFDANVVYVPHYPV